MATYCSIGKWKLSRLFQFCIGDKEEIICILRLRYSYASIVLNLRMQIISSDPNLSSFNKQIHLIGYENSGR
ncbi:hypothetical protein MTR_7g064935 [Medicago truncatula]|uniref:Uncharacterized protein n=1 Tax=Medicago truncatula TaxID=3880 RepID=A0A072U0T2_MEDTR|nr:hypothetical protein MTR_7g064935 [Medicago truncatula]